jgi:hypothetical protein
MTDKAIQAIRAFFEGKGIPSLNSAKFTEENHRSDNRVILHFHDLLNGYQIGASRITGYTEHPAHLECNGYGIMFEDFDGNEFWCHIDEEMVLMEADDRLCREEFL